MLLIQNTTLPAATPGLAQGVMDRVDMRAHQVRVPMSAAGCRKALAAATAFTGSLPLKAEGDVAMDQTPKQWGPSFTLQGVSIDETSLKGELTVLRDMLEALK